MGKAINPETKNRRIGFAEALLNDEHLNGLYKLKMDLFFSYQILGLIKDGKIDIYLSDADKKHDDSLNERIEFRVSEIKSFYEYEE